MKIWSTCALFAALAVSSTVDASEYADVKANIAARRAELARLSRHSLDPSTVKAVARAEILINVAKLAKLWLGTRWGLGVPQLSEPGSGKINCGTFVGTVLRDAGFRVPVKKLQRQPSQLIIRSFVGRSRMKKFSNASMETFREGVREMGSGMFIIGLDFHVGILIQSEQDLRFIHASYETGTVVNEAATSAGPIVDSKYRVVGKILDDGNIRDWLNNNRIRVKGNW